MDFSWLDSFWKIALLVLVASALVRAFFGTWGLKGELRAIQDGQQGVADAIATYLNARLTSHQNEMLAKLQGLERELDSRHNKMLAKLQGLEGALSDLRRSVENQTGRI